MIVETFPTLGKIPMTSEFALRGEGISEMMRLALTGHKHFVIAATIRANPEKYFERPA